MIKLRHNIFITLVVILSLVAVEARYYPPKPLRGGNPEVLDILLRGDVNPEISTVLSDSPKPILRIGHPAVAATHRDNLKPVAGGYPKVDIPIGNPAVAAMLRDNLGAIPRGGTPKISAMLRDSPKPFLLASIPEIPAMPRGKPKHYLLAGIPELTAMPHANPKPNLHGPNVLAMLREYTKPLLNNPSGLRVRKDSEPDTNLFPTFGINKYTIKDNDLKETFNKMVETVVKVNDERILSLKKFFELDNYLPQVSRSTKQKNPLIVIMNTPNYKPKYDNLNINHLTEDPQYVIVKKKHKEPSMLNILKEIIEGSYFKHNEDHDEVNISQESDETRFTKNLKTYLSVWKICNINASKCCEIACKKALKTICNDYQCNKSMKKDGKKQCKKRCEAEFMNSDESESDE